MSVLLRSMLAAFFMLGAALPAAAQIVSGPVATCARDALRQLIVFDGVQSQQTLTDRAGRAWGTEVIFRGKVLGKRDTYRCTYTNATKSTEIELYRPATKPPASGPASQKTAEAACTKAAQGRNLSVGKIVAATPNWAGKELVTWIVEMTVFDKDGAKTASCRYDVRSTKAVLDVRKPATR